MPLNWQCRDLGSIRQAVGDDGTRNLREQGGTLGVVGVDDGRAAWSEQLQEPRLDATVVLNRTVIVEMVAADIGEDRRVEFNPRHAPLTERVARDLHYRM